MKAQYLDVFYSPFQPDIGFTSLLRINFGWLLAQNLSLNFGQETTSTGIFIFAADSNVQLFYYSAEMTGLI